MRALAVPRRTAWIPLGLALVLAAVGMGHAPQAHASTMYVRGVITDIHTVPCGTTVALACTQSTLHGDLTGTSFSAVTSVVPSATEGVIFSNVTVVLTAPDGSTLHNSASGVNNTSSSGYGESVLLGELTGGTGQFAGASGYLQVRANFNASSGVPGYGDYQGVLNLS